jgi:hypothetical protein
MKQTTNKTQNKLDSSLINVLGQHAAIRPVIDHDLPRTASDMAYTHGRDFSQMPLNSTESASLRTNETQSCPFTPQRCPFGGACHTCPPRVQASQTVGIQRKATNNDEHFQIPPIVHEVLELPGQPLDKGTRDFFEPRFGHDFSQVRVHTDTRAAESARAVNALAYTVGHNIVFGACQYKPRTVGGQRLMSHELTHVAQQNAGGLQIMPQADLKINTQGDASEQEAEQTADFIGNFADPAGADKWYQKPERIQFPTTASQAHLQRFFICTLSENGCPPRKPGELERARRGPMKLEIIDSPVQGLLISNFDSGSSKIKKDLESNPKWAPFWGDMVIKTDRRWKVVGFSDCHGTDGENQLLRWDRAIAVNNLLPTYARKQVDKFDAAPISECIDDDKTEAGREHNRSAVIMKTSETITFEKEDVVVGKLRLYACFDGEKVSVNKGGKTASCPAMTSAGAGATPAGRYLVRNQGEAQITGGLIGAVAQDRSKWYLLEPQFATSRYRMHLHPGSHSAGCVTVTDKNCFEKLASVLNNAGKVTGDGYDGYPPGNTAGKSGTEVKNQKKTVTGIGWIVVNYSKGICNQ